MRNTIPFIAFAIIFIFSLPNAAPAQGETGPDKGELVFNKHCASCHGITARGTDKGPPLIHRVYRPDHHGDMSFHLAVRIGVRAHHFRFGNMPPIQGVSTDEVDEIIRFVRGLQKEAGVF